MTTGELILGAFALVGIYLVWCVVEIGRAILSLRKGERNFYGMTVAGRLLKEAVFTLSKEHALLQWQLRSSSLRKLSVRDLEWWEEVGNADPDVLLAKLIAKISEEFRAASVAIVIKDQVEVAVKDGFVTEREEIREYLLRGGRGVPEHLGIDFEIREKVTSKAGQIGYLWWGYPFAERPTKLEEFAAREVALFLGLHWSAIEELRVLGDKVKESSALSEKKSEFLAQVTHDLRTPLSNIEGVLKVLQWSVEDREKQELLDAGLRSCKALGEMTSDVLDFARARAGALVARTQELSLKPLLEEIIGECSRFCTGSDLAVKMVFPAEELMVNADKIHFRRILSNILTNAMKHTEKGGVTISVSADGPFGIKLKVQDTGKGIAPALQTKLFTAFAKGDSDEGIGLGLLVTKLLVEANGGTLSLHSEVGKGTEVVVSLPGKCGENPALGAWKKFA